MGEHFLTREGALRSIYDDRVSRAKNLIDSIKGLCDMALVDIDEGNISEAIQNKSAQYHLGIAASYSQEVVRELQVAEVVKKELER